MTTQGKRKSRRRVLLFVAWNIGVFAVAFAIYFPGCQTPLAFTLATGIGMSGLQAHVDRLQEKAIKGEEFAEKDKRFLRNLYTCVAKGGRLTLVLRQSSRMMRHYLSKSGDDLRTAPRIFVNSRPVQEQMEFMREEILLDLEDSGRLEEVYSTGTFYMGDPKFFDSMCGLYFGRLWVRPSRTENDSLLLDWRAEVPWDWPTYESLYEEYGEYHRRVFLLPNARSLLFGQRHSLQIEDGLGGHLPRLGLAKPFLLYSEWNEEFDTKQVEKN